MAVYNDHDTDLDELERSFHGPDATESGSDTLQRRKEQDNLESSYNAPDAKESGSAKIAGADELKDKEKQTPPDRSGFSAGDDIKERLGKGYTGKGSTKSKFLSKLYNSKSANKKKVAIAVAAAGTSAGLSAFLFLALLPLKIDTVIKNFETKYSAEANGAIDSELDNAYSKFVAQKVLPNLGKGTCHSTIDPGCVSVSNGTTPIGKLYNAWRQGNLEQKLATGDPKIVLGKRGNQLYMNIGGTGYASAGIMDQELKDVMSQKKTLMDVGGTNPTTKSQIRTAVKKARKNATLWDKAYYRFKIAPLITAKYGVKFCLTKIGCDLADKITDTSTNIKQSAVAYMYQRVIGPFSQSKALIMTCIMAGNCDVNPSDISSDPNDPEKVSHFQADLQARLASYAATYGTDKLTDLVEKANAISKAGGLTKYYSSQLLSSATAKFGGGDAAQAVASGTVEKAFSIGSWAQMAASIVRFINNTGPELKAMNYATSAAAAVSMYSMYAAIAGQQQSGHIDAGTLGSFTDALSSGGVDMTTTPYYNATMGDGETQPQTTAFLDNFLPSAYADAAPSAGKYLCSNGRPISTGHVLCDEEVFDGGNAFLSDISKGANDIPGWSALVSLANVVSTVSSVTGFVGDALSAIPGIHQAVGAIGQLGSTLLGILGDHMLPNIMADGTTAKNPTQPIPSGGRNFDLIGGGDDVVQNKSCQVTLGCAEVTNGQVADAQSEQIADAKADFNSQSMFARIFSTTSPYSLISRLAMAMPTNMLTATNDTLSSLLANPFSKLGGMFSALLTSNHAFAAATAAPDPFGVVQYGYTSVPSDPDTYWKDNCVSGPMAIYDASTDTLDVSAWLQKENADPDTGEAVTGYGQQNPCLLIHSMVQVAGAAFNGALVPSNAANSDPVTPTTPATTDPTTGDPTAN